jgi:predicted nucleotidyltransferase
MTVGAEGVLAAVEAEDLGALEAVPPAAAAPAAAGDDFSCQGGKSASETNTMIKEQDLGELVTRLKSAAGGNLQSVILYGSAAAGEFHEGHSDLNVLCVMRSLAREELSTLHEASFWWAKKGHPAPLFFTLHELQYSADIFAIELYDIKAAYRVLDGDDVIAGLEVPMYLHRLQVERELRNSSLRLRQQYIRHPEDSRKTLELMTSSISTFLTLFRHALIALGELPPATKRESLNRLESVIGFDVAPFLAILEIRERRKREREFDVQETFGAYLGSVSKVVDEIDRRLAGPSANG